MSRALLPCALAAVAMVGAGSAAAQPGATLPPSPPPEPTPAAEPAVPATTAAPAPAATSDDDDGPARRLELGGFLGLDYFGDDIELGNSWAPEQVPGTSLLAGARLGLILFPDLARGSDLDPQLGLEVEAKLAVGKTGSSEEGGRDSFRTAVMGTRVQLLARLKNSSPWTPHLVVGVGGESLFTSSPFAGDDTDAAFHWGPGVSRPLFGRWDLRVDLRHGLTAGRTDGIVSTFELQAGLSTGWDLGRSSGGSSSGGSCESDRDGDAIVDDRDRCPNEPETVNDFEDIDGCPDVADHDGDGILDPDDRCPYEAENFNQIDDEDGCAEIDEDGDGLLGSRDVCPRAAEDVDRFLDEDGCPDPDNDNDGLPDNTDLCPDNAEVRNGFDDEDGCPDTLPTALTLFTGTIEGITFATGKAIIRPTSRPTLDKAIATLKEYPTIKFRIEGHTDDRGKRELNLDLSQRRADAVRRYLVDKGIAEDRISTVGHGPDVPRDTNKTPKGRERNRRIEFHILVQEPIAVPMTVLPATQPTAPATQPTQPAPPATTLP